MYIIALVVSYLWRRFYPLSAVNPVHYEPLQEPAGEEAEDFENIKITTLSDNTSITDDAQISQATTEL